MAWKLRLLAERDDGTRLGCVSGPVTALEAVESEVLAWLQRLSSDAAQVSGRHTTRVEVQVDLCDATPLAEVKG